MTQKNDFRNKREIKFRAWCVAGMFEVNDLYFDKGQAELNDGDVRSFKSITIMQFTGLKDKNGKEIYEGDIVKTLFMGQEGIIIGEVIWADSGFFVGYKEYKDDLFPWSFYKMVEVIGNIYENPRLLSSQSNRKVKK